MTTASEQQNGHSPEDAPAGYPDFASARTDYGARFEMPPREGSGDDDNQGFSKFLHHMSEEMHSIRGIIMQGHITDRKEQLLLLGLLDIFRIYITAEAATRQERWDEEERLANRCKGRMAEETTPKAPDGRDLVEALLHEWYTGAALEQIARVLKHKQGYQRALEQLADYDEDGRLVAAGREQVAEARARQQRAIFNAAGLPPAHAEYFWCRLRQTSISMERQYDLARGVPTVDYTQVRKEITNGVPLHKLADKLPWPMQEIYSRVIVSQSDGDRIRDWIGAMYIRQWPWSQQAPPELRKLALDERNDMDSDTGRRKSDDRKDDRKNDRKKDKK